MASRAFYLGALLAWMGLVWAGLEWAARPSQASHAVPTADLDWPSFFAAYILPSLPVADNFVTPLRPPDGEGVYVTLPFLEQGHLGEDWATVKGDGTLGEPVYSVADGWVAVAQDFEAAWGKVAFIDYRLSDGRFPPFIEVMYAQLQTLDVHPGQFVKKGQRIGTVGNAGGTYLAHLHWEVRQTVGLGIGPGFSDHRDGWLEPSDILRAHRGDRSQIPLAPKVLDKSQRNGWGSEL